jgi:hypothetical protein
MGLQLPSEVAWLLNELGYTWPEADEEKLFQLGQNWIGFAGKLPAIADDSHTAAQQTWTNSKGQGVNAFQTSWTDRDAPHATLGDAITGAQVVGACFFVCAGIVLALKINVIIQLIQLAIEIAEAISTAPPTFGASLLEIPVFKEITGRLIQMLVNLAMEPLLG